MTVVHLDMAYCSFREVLAGLDTRLNTPPSIDSHHPYSGLAPPTAGTVLCRAVAACGNRRPRWRLGCAAAERRAIGSETAGCCGCRLRDRAAMPTIRRA